MNDTPDLETLAHQLIDDQQLETERLFIESAGVRLCLRSNSSELIKKLRGYFLHVLAEAGEAAIEVLAIEMPPAELGLSFTDWQREPGKAGRKDSYLDLPGARLVRKVRTGMLFLQSETWRIAAGPCLANDNQVINFINSQLMNVLQQQQWLICHAAALVSKRRALGLAGFSGGGKSTLMLHLLEQPEVGYLTNDRLFIKPQEGQVMAQGIPKLPRINPGTLVGSERLRSMVSAEQIDQWQSLPAETLWHLEQKYDVSIAEVYGPDRIIERAPLGAFVVLNWRRDSDQPTELQRVDLEERQDLLSAIMKSPGPFYQDLQGRFLSDQEPLEPRPYLEGLAGVPIYEAKGRLDFAALIPQCLEVL